MTEQELPSLLELYAGKERDIRHSYTPEEAAPEGFIHNEDAAVKQSGSKKHSPGTRLLTGMFIATLLVGYAYALFHPIDTNLPLRRAHVASAASGP